MAQKRELDPNFFTDDRVLSVSPLARFLLQGLWCWADDCGHVNNRPREFKLRILPGDHCDIQQLLNELEDQCLIVVYKDGRVEIPSMHLHAHSSKPIRTLCEQCQEDENERTDPNYV